MSEHMKSLNQNVIKQVDELELGQDSQSPCARILIAAQAHVCSDQTVAQLMQQYQCRRVRSLDEARHVLKHVPFDLMLLDPQLAGGDGHALAKDLQEVAPATKTIILSEQHSAQAAVQAMRCGAIDFVHAPQELNDLSSRIQSALARSRADRRREQRLVRLKKVCKQLNMARHEISEQIDLLCHDLVSAYQDMSNQVHEAALASEFRTLLKQELDVEDMLRTALEYTLTKTGPTNAAVFLPDGSSRFALGAYVNYDCPRDTIDLVLERLGNAVCPQIAQHDEILTFQSGRSFTEWVGIDAGMLGDSEVVALSCDHEGECLAIIILFRSQKTPFDNGLLSMIDTLRPIFAEQLAQIVKVHQRAQPQWPEDAADDSDEMDYNDDFGFGYGDLAA